MDVVHRDVHVAVVVDVAKRGAAPGVRRSHRRAETFGHVLEAAVLKVPVDDLALPIARLGSNLFDLRIDVAVDQEEIEPAVLIEIEETDAPPEPPRVEPDAARERAIRAETVAAVRIQRGGVAGEVGLEDVDRAVA